MYSKVGDNKILTASGNLLHSSFFFFLKINRTPLFNLIIEAVVTK